MTDASCPGLETNRSPLDTSLAVRVTFVVPRPKGHYHWSTRRHGEVKENAPACPTVKPDTTKLMRALEDACTGILWRDDAQIVLQVISKVYGKTAGAFVEVWTSGGDE
jgi:Holliday junction resolvase RusA-like endonuclease